MIPLFYGGKTKGTKLVGVTVTLTKVNGEGQVGATFCSCSMTY